MISYIGHEPFWATSQRTVVVPCAVVDGFADSRMPLAMADKHMPWFRLRDRYAELERFSKINLAMPRLVMRHAGVSDKGPECVFMLPIKMRVGNVVRAHLLNTAMHNLLHEMDRFHISKVAMPPLGVGPDGGLDMEELENILWDYVSKPLYKGIDIDLHTEVGV